MSSAILASQRQCSGTRYNVAMTFGPLVDVDTWRATSVAPDGSSWIAASRLTDPTAGRGRVRPRPHSRRALRASRRRPRTTPERERGPSSVTGPAAFAATLGRLRHRRDDCTVVAYDEASGAIAARLWWLLRWLGHRAQRGSRRRHSRLGTPPARRRADDTAASQPRRYEPRQLASRARSWRPARSRRAKRAGRPARRRTRGAALSRRAGTDRPEGRARARCPQSAVLRTT